ncbi:hypothetical protein [Stakelama saccharophila]|uniref:Phage shock protein B n=1 Tax=Stakelama saccharophila TaxID=3075605 RepID=A0ABZ0B7C0_9SPHN|nr:hypothetical protein [Stakelama sp. W311]WNO52763.1 hypothetical protein RPR59_09840 [Stakelama sp. W311]
MNPFEMVVAIIVIVTIGRIIQTRMKVDGERGARTEDTAEAMRMRDEIRSLKERIAVLERVITDNHNSINLDREIERLRDSDRI